jgi:hypothetical protein
MNGAQWLATVSEPAPRTEYRVHRTYLPGPPDAATRLVAELLDQGQPVARVDLVR